MFHYPEHHASIISHMSDMTQEEHHTRNISLEYCAYRHTRPLCERDGGKSTEEET
jgi:hypothetical protein